jgi:hypothetical protein
MVNRPKNIGTAAETAVVRAARPRGFPGADRLTLTGALDRGDVGLCPGVIVEVKGGDAARTASDGMIDGWLIETERERVNAGADVAFLVTQRAGVGPANAHRWWAWWRYSWIADLGRTGIHPRLIGIPVRMQLGDALQLLRAAGYGDPLDVDEANAPTNVPGSVRVQEVA